MRRSNPFNRKRVATALGLMLAASAGVSLLSATAASAHPLGNFTTNTATRLVVSRANVGVRYTVDLAEIPALQVRQELGVVTGAVPDAVANPWRDRTCAAIGQALDVTVDAQPLALEAAGTTALAFVPGQAGLNTIRLECGFRAARASGSVSESGPAAAITVRDSNFADRLGWREITAVGDGVRLNSAVRAVSLTNELRRYPAHAATSPLHERDASFTATPDATRQAPADSSGSAAPVGSRGNDGLTQRFQSLVAHREITIPFAIGATLLAIVLGGFHALAPGHGKTIMAAYAVSRRGRRGDILAIGGTVALTHTIGILILGALVTASSSVSPSGALRWTSIASGVLVVVVGISLVRSRLRGPRLLAALTDHAVVQQSQGTANAPGHSLSHDEHSHTDHSHSHADHAPADHSPADHSPADHDHSHAEHSHSHDDHSHAAQSHHAHPHPHEHPHPHPHAPAAGGEQGAVVRAHPTDDRFIVTSHVHGGWQHDHVLPAPGALVRRRELIAMGLAGGLVPSPSALVVLLGAIALGRIPFGLLLVVAYGIGLACTLVAAGLVMVRFESRVRRWTESRGTVFGGGLVAVANALPLLSGLAIIGAGTLLVLRSLRMG